MLRQNLSWLPAVFKIDLRSVQNHLILYWGGWIVFRHYSSENTKYLSRIHQCNTHWFDCLNIQITLREYSIFAYEYCVSLEQIYSLFVSGQFYFGMYIWGILGADLVDICQTLSIYLSIKHRMFNIWIWILYFIGINIFGICIRDIFEYAFRPKFDNRVTLESR